MATNETLESMRAWARFAFAECRLDFLRWALPQCSTDEQYKMAGSIAQAIGDVSFAEAQEAFTRELTKEPKS
jgi:hypothetical protein